MNNCADVTSQGILACLENLNLLERIEANKGHNSTVQQAIKMLNSEQCHQEDATIKNTLVEKTNIASFPNIKHFLFRNPRAGLEVVSKYCPSLNKVRSISLFCQDNENYLKSPQLIVSKIYFYFLRSA